MANKKGEGDKAYFFSQPGKENEGRRKELRELAKCEQILSDTEVITFGQIAEQVANVEGNVSSSDEFDEHIENEYRRLIQILDVQPETHSLTRIELTLSPDVKFGSRSGTLHLGSRRFPPLSRGLQGGAVAVAAFATTAVLKPKCWNREEIDQVVDDGDTYYCESFKDIIIDDRRKLTILDFRRDLVIQNTFRIFMIVDEPAFVGMFRSEDPTVLHLVKALELFFERYDAGILTSPVLNIAIWKDANNFYIFDGQARKKDCEVVGPGEEGSAKLILVRDMIGLYFIILEKSKVGNEHFVLYGISIASKQKKPPEGFEDIKDPSEPLEPRPSGYKIQSTFRAVLQGSYHLTHQVLPEELRGRGHLVVALAALIYTRLVETKRWRTPMLDLIFNQSHIYLVDLARVLEKKFDDTFDLKVEELMSDVILGVYAAKIKVEVNVVPGEGKKGKATLETGIREFFDNNQLGILEIKNIFYAIWKEGNKYYLLDPFACDIEGFRPDPEDPDDEARYKQAKACVTMNSSINELIETILENTESTEKDTFIVHGIRVLYVKTGIGLNGPFNRVIYREENINRRPEPPTVPPPDVPDECENVMDMVPKKRPTAEKFKNAESEFPELMDNIVDFMMKDNEPTTFIEGKPEEITNRKAMSTDRQENTLAEKEINFIRGYKIVNPHRLILQGSKNCLAKDFEKSSRGRQGLIIALTAIAYGKLKEPSQWRSIDVNQVIDVGHKAFEDTIAWIRQGSPVEKEKGEGEEDADEDEDDDESVETDEDDDEEDDENDDEENENEKAVKLKAAPSHLELSMLPEKLKLGENVVTFKQKMNLVKGNANPLANLGEAFEHYFQRHSELVIENKKLFYGIWKYDENYFVFNPYGSDEEGWRIRGFPASFAVINSLHELTDLFYAILEFNDSQFYFHFVEIESIQPNNKYIATNPTEVDENEGTESYLTKFLPITDEDLFKPEPEPKVEEKDEKKVEEEEEDEDDDDEEDDEDDEDDEDEEDEEDEEEDEEDEEDEDKKEDDKEVQADVPSEVKKKLVDPLLEVPEMDQSDPPEHLNLSLITGAVKIDMLNENDQMEVNDDIKYERLKYSLPRPYVQPPKKLLSTLLKAKQASRSVPSLISRFSVDSQLAMKEKSDLPGTQPTETANIINIDSSEEKVSKIIKLPPKKYLFSRVPSVGFTPIRAINDDFIHDEDEECEKKREVNNDNEVLVEVPEIPTGVRILPKIVPLGPVISTPIFKKEGKPCPEKKKRECKISKKDKGDVLLEKLICNTEDVLFKMIFPKAREEEQIESPNKEKESEIDKNKEDSEGKSGLKMKDSKQMIGKKPIEPEPIGFEETDDEKIAIIGGNMCLENRVTVEDSHFKSCYFASILCIIAKAVMNVNHFRGSILDQFIIIGDKIYQRTGRLRYKPLRWFHNIEILDLKCNVILKQVQYADPENWEMDALPQVLSTYLKKNKTGILVFGNVSYAFWLDNNMYYLFDPYACDENGRANEEGFSCLMQFCDLPSMIARIAENTGEQAEKSYRLYTLSLAHIESKKRNEISRKRRKLVDEESTEEEEKVDKIEEEEEVESLMEPKPEFSLIELTKWVTEEKKCAIPFDMTLPGFAPVRNYKASVLEVTVVENDITRPELSPFKKEKRKPDDHEVLLDKMIRLKSYNRRFKEHTCLSESIDLCIMGWACVHDPISWGIRTVKGLYEASKDYAFDSLLANEDTTVTEMTDGVLLEFNIANYTFRIVFAPIHEGTLYAVEGWNLAMSVKKVFDTSIYTGAILVCGRSHIGLMRKNENNYAWWAVPGTKNLRFITSEDMEDFLKLIVQEINEPKETRFLMRVVTISYAQKLDPDCSDIVGLHESVVPATSLAEVHRKESKAYDLEDIFRPTVTNTKPTFIFGTVSLRNRDTIKEPRVKRCYFVSLLAVMVKRDIVQSPMPGMVDKVLEVAENLYRQFDDPKYHTEHILRNVTVMDRIFEFRDCASSLVEIKKDLITGSSNFFVVVRKELRKHFQTHTDGILHFTNCCYAFWYSKTTNRYYYLDPYQCDQKGRRVSTGGKSCLFICSNICDMVHYMYLNKFEETTGFFIHNLHVESVNESSSNKFREDPIWIYLDYHWSFCHGLEIKKRKKHRQIIIKQEKPSWNHYVIEVPKLIYSVWGTIGCWDSRFGERAGKNQAAICVAILAMQNLSNPSQWSPAILDSAVICGDCYYTESLKSSARNCCRHQNRFNLQNCFKISPHVWSIEFKSNMCGMLYGGRERMPLSVILKLALAEAPNILIECGKTVLAVCSTDDGYYAADPCWTGPPLFPKNHGSVYILRCRNLNTLVYVLIKMLNTNQRLEFHVTPLIISFRQEVCSIGAHPNKKILTDPVQSRPGQTLNECSLIPGAVTVPSGDEYHRYNKHVRLGIQYGDLFEDPPIPSPEPKLSKDKLNNVIMSTLWHLNVGKVLPKKHTRRIFDPLSIEHVPEDCLGSRSAAMKIPQNHLSITDIFERCNDYPKVIDFVNDSDSSEDTIMMEKSIIDKRSRSPVDKPVECLVKPSFILRENRKKFKKRTRDMRDEEYKKIMHRVSVKKDNETDEEYVSDEAVAGDIEQITEDENKN